MNDPHFIIIRNLVDSMIYEQMTDHIFLYFFFFQNFVIFSNALKKFLTFCFWKCIYDICLNECMNFFRKCTYEYIIFFLNAYIVHVWKKISKKKMLLWMHDFFLNAYMMYVWIFFFVRKCIYEILDFFFLKMHLWMHDFFWIHI